MDTITFTVKLSLERVATELALFYHNNGGWRILPKCEKQQAEAGRIFTLTDDWDSNSAPAEIILLPLSEQETGITLRPNIGEVFDLRLDDPVRSTLDRTAYLGGSTSQRNVEFLEQFADYIRGLAAQAEATTQPQSAMPAKPPEPDTRNLEDWFDYYHRCRKAGYKVTLKELAEKTGYSHGHVRQRHAEYMAEHGHT